MIVIRTQPTCMGRTYATAHTGITKKKIGRIDMIVGADAGYLRIDSFGVEEKYRRKGVGKKLIEAMIAEAKRIGGKEIIVYPSPECYANEKPLDIKTLYKIYEALGFVLDNPNADISRRNNKMTMQV